MSTTMNGSLNLEKLVHKKKKMKGKDGKPIDIIILPVEANHFYVGEKSTNLNFRLVIHDEPDQYDNDGFISKQVPMKLMFGDKKWKDLTDDEKQKKNDAEPILGNFRGFGGGNTNAGYESAEVMDDDDDDLMF